jgi:hypothetical protein
MWSPESLAALSRRQAHVWALEEYLRYTKPILNQRVVRPIQTEPAHHELDQTVDILIVS